MFRDLGFSDFEDALSRSYREWEYCVQYRETSFDFVSRLMEQEGIYYWFRHEKKRHILVLSDAYGAHHSPAGYTSVPYYPPSLGHRERDHFFDWHMAREVQPGSLSLNDYDFQRPGTRLEVRSNVGRAHAAADYPLYDYPGEYVQSQDGEHYARTRIEAIQTQYERVRLRGCARGIGAGHLFHLSNYPRLDQNREYLVVGAEYRVVQELYETGNGGGGAQFESELDCIDAGQAFRPLPSTPVPVVRGPQTAVVVGPKGEEIWTDQYGRVKVHFHWEAYAAGPLLNLPFPNRERARGRLDSAAAERDAALARFDGAVLGALREVERALALYAGERQRRADLQRALDEQRHAYRLARSNYRAGALDALELLDSQRSLVADRARLVDAEMRVAERQVELFRALGGGWQAAPSPSHQENGQ